MVVDGVQENQSRIENEEHDHSLLARRVVGVDLAGDVLDSADIESIGTKKAQSVSDVEVVELLDQILKEVKKTNLHLSIITDNYFKNTEVE